MDRATRKELKSDKFALEVQHGFEYVTEHQNLLVRWGGIAVAAVIVIVGIWFYMGHQKTARQEALQHAMRIENATVGQAQSPYALAYPTQAEKDKAADKEWSDLAAKYSGSEVGDIAEYFLASHAANNGNVQEAEKRFKLVVDSGNKDYASLAKLSLAQLYGAQGKVDDARKLLQSLIDHPTAMVSKDEATIVLARVLAPADPQGARKLLEPLRSSDRNAVSRAALSALAELPK